MAPDRASSASSRKVNGVFRPYTQDSQQRIEEKKNTVLKDLGFIPKKQPSIPDGSILPYRFEPVPKYLYGIPLEEIENGLYDKNFCVISKRFSKNYIYRLTATNSLFIFSPLNPIRRACIGLVMNQYFDYCMILTIMVNCVFLALSTPVETAEYVFLSIYTTEMIIKSIGKGFILNKYSYLRIPWNWLDFIVINLGFVTLFIDLKKLTGLRTFRVLRALKTVSILPGLKTIVNALLHSMQMLAEVMFLTVFCLMVFSLFALQIYRGVLRNKCIQDPEIPLFNSSFDEFVLNRTNWLLEDQEDSDSFLICGNASGAFSCPANSSCLPDIGPNPDFGYTSFDNFGSSMLTTFQLITLDFWENIYDKVLAACGPFSVIFFVFVVFFGSFYLINLMLAVVAMSYEEEVEVTQSEMSQGGSSTEDTQTQKTGNTPAKKPKKKRIITRRGAITITDSITAEESEPPQPPPTAPALTEPLVAAAVRRDIPFSRGGLRTAAGGRPSRRPVFPTGPIMPGAQFMDPTSHVPPRPRPRALIMCECGLEMCEQGPQMRCTFSRGNLNSRRGRPMNNSNNSPTDSGLGEDPADSDNSKMPQAQLSADSTISNVTIPSALNDMYDDNMHSDELGDDRHSADIVIIEDQYPDRNCKHCQSCCVCFPTWLRVQNAIYNFVHDPLIELFITLCIIVNTIFLAIEHHGMSSSLKQTLDIGNKVFTAIFFLETLLKLISMAKDYFKKSWNVFDLFIVIGSLMDLSLENVGGLSVLRALRLLRVFKLAQSWTTMRVLLSIIVSTLGALGNLTLVLVIIMYIFAVLGMQLFGRYYVPERFDKNEIPRWNFKDFVHSFMMIFRVLCGEWVEPLWDCMHAAGQSCMAIFLPALVVGNFIVLNLFLALLLSSFNSEELSKNNKKDEEASRLVLGLKRLKNLICCCRNAVTPLPSARRRLSRENSIEIDSNNLKTEKMMAAFASTVFVDTEELKSRKNATTNTPSDMANNTNIPLRHEIRRPSWTQVVDYVDNLRHGSQDSLQVSDQIFQVNNPMSSNYVLEPNTMDAATQTPDSLSLSSPSPNYTPPPIVRKRTITPNRRIRAGADKPRTDTPPSDPKEIDTDAIYAKASGGFLEEPEETKPEIEKEPEDCLPSCCYKRFICCRAYAANYSPRLWYRFRKLTMKFVDHWLFEWFIVILIFASSITLCFEDKYLQDNQQLVNVLYYLNWFFCAVYTIEMILKWIAHGFVVYFTNGWSILDFIIVAASIFSIVIEDNKNLIALRSMRTLRALRPLRAISRWQGMKIVVNALMSAIPSIFNVLLVCIVFWLIFSIMGVQFFAGRFYRCEYEDGSRVPITVVNNRSECEQKNLFWKNADINFDNVGQGYLALFQVATFEGWMEVMEDAVDARGVDLQPHTEANLTAYFYFIIFIVCGSFFTLNLFIGVIIDNFNMLKKKYEGGVLNLFLTESQKNYYAAMKKLGRKKPQKLIPRPSNCFHAAFYDVAMSRRFEMLIFFLILLNMITMGVEHYKQTEKFEYVLEILNIVFTSLFVTEALIKIIGLRHWYFRVPWNVFDFILVTSSLLGIILKDILTNFIVSPSLLRVVRVFRIGRILRLIKAAKGIRKLLFALVVSLPALFNIGALIFLIMFIYAIIGMSLFSRIKHTDAIDDLVNFETFGRSMLLLFRLLTSAGWNDILDPLMIQPPDCNPNIGKLPNGDCGNPTMAIIYLVSYVIINFMIIINMYIAVILENFNQAHQEEELGIVEDDIEMFYMHWARFDPYATQFISFFELSDFVDSLDQPLKISKPNMIAIVSFNLPIARGMKIHCLDILHALVKHVLGHVEETDDFQKLRSQMEAKFKKQFPTRKQLELITTTLQWKRVDHAVRILQKGYRNHMRAKKRREEGADPNAPIPNSRPTSRLGRSLRTLSQLLTRQGSSNKFSLRQASRPPTAKSKKGRRGSDASVNSIFYIPPET